MIKRVVLSNLVAAVLSVGVAQAADLAQKPMATKAPAPAAFSWTGFYIGAEAGYAWGNNGFTNSYDPLNPSTLLPVDASYSLDGGMVGGQIGYNYQIGQFVLGIEADAAWANISGNGYTSNNIAPSCIQSNDACHSKIDALGTITGRFGVAFGQTLLYAKGGAAWGQVNHTAGYTAPLDPGFNYSASTDQTRWGWTVGGGAEYAFTKNWSAKVEYNYIDFGSSDVTFAFVPGTWVNPYKTTSDLTLSVVKAGVNYRF